MNRFFTFVLLSGVFLFHSCRVGDISMKKFRQCYPAEKFHSLSLAIEMMDSGIQSFFPDSTILSAYVAYSLECCHKADYPVTHPIFSDNEKERLTNQLTDAGIIDDIEISNKSPYHKSDFYKCLSNQKKGDIFLTNYIENIESIMDNPGYAQTIGTFPGIMDQKGIGDIHIFILKANLLINF